MAVFNLVSLAFCCFANSVSANIEKAASSYSLSFSYSLEPEKMSWLFSATGNFTGDRNAGSFVMEETANIIGFTDRPFRAAKPMALANVARQFEGAQEFNPPNAVLTITENSCTQEENVVSIPVTLRSHTYFENEPDKMGFTYTLLGEVTTRQNEALQCQQCPLAIFVDGVAHIWKFECEWFDDDENLSCADCDLAMGGIGCDDDLLHRPPF